MAVKHPGGGMISHCSFVAIQLAGRCPDVLANICARVYCGNSHQRVMRYANCWKGWRYRCHRGHLQPQG